MFTTALHSPKQAEILAASARNDPRLIQVITMSHTQWIHYR